MRLAALHALVQGAGFQAGRICKAMRFAETMAHARRRAMKVDKKKVDKKKADKKKADKKGKRNRHAAQTPVKPRHDHDEDGDIGDDDMLPLSVVRIWMDVVRSWRRCRRPACKRGRSCRGRYAQCAGERPPLSRRRIWKRTSAMVIAPGPSFSGCWLSAWRKSKRRVCRQWPSRSAPPRAVDATLDGCCSCLAGTALRETPHRAR